ncbi:MAG: hypothetical protein GYB65_06400 [Chloroflexi bacterium]|nr:hypothetical protein [Chloroflexota bacterium]
MSEVVQAAHVSPGMLCRVIANQQIAYLPVEAYFHIARWLKMPLANVMVLAKARPKLPDLVQVGMIAHGYTTTSTQDQMRAANEAGISVAVFRRALHGYADFMPSMQTCDRLAAWLAWTGFQPDDIVYAAGMLVQYKPDGTRVTISPDVARQIKPYPCACGRAGCMVPAHIPSGPRRIWRSDACRMWAKRRAEREGRALGQKAPPNGIAPPQRDPIVRFIAINERPVPVRF